MRRIVIIVSAVVVAVGLAAPAAAEPPEISAFTSEQVFWIPVDNPCTPEVEEITFNLTSRFKEILRPGVRRITVIDSRVTGEGAWRGHGTDTGVELLAGQGELVNFRFMATNTETGQKIRVVFAGHRNDNTGVWNTGPGPALTVECVKG